MIFVLLTLSEPLKRRSSQLTRGIKFTQITQPKKNAISQCNNYLTVEWITKTLMLDWIGWPGYLWPSWLLDHLTVIRIIGQPMCCTMLVKVLRGSRRIAEIDFFFPTRSLFLIVLNIFYKPTNILYNACESFAGAGTRQSLFVSQLFRNFIPASSETFPSKCAIFDIETKAVIFWGWSKYWYPSLR